MNSIIENNQDLTVAVKNGDNRFVIWTQGCPFHCDGCFNQPTHNQTGGFDMDIAQLADEINKTPNIRGITLTGGEPLLQVKQVSLLLKLIRKDLDVLLFSGFTWNEIKADTIKKQLLTQIDATLLGRYNKNLPHPFYGKKLVVNGNRIKKEELKPWLNTEIVINGNNVQITGLYKQSEKINEVC